MHSLNKKTVINKNNEAIAFIIQIIQCFEITFMVIEFCYNNAVIISSKPR